MAYVPVRTDESGHSHVDGKFPAFDTAVEATIGGFGVRRADGTFEVLDALPLGRAATQNSIEAGSATIAATTNDSDYAAVDFETVDYLDDSEVLTSTALDSDMIVSDLTD